MRKQELIVKVPIDGVGNLVPRSVHLDPVAHGARVNGTGTFGQPLTQISALACQIIPIIPHHPDDHLQGGDPVSQCLNLVRHFISLVWTFPRPARSPS